MWHVIKIPIRASWTSIINTLLQVTNNAVNKNMWYKFLSLSDIDRSRIRGMLPRRRDSRLYTVKSGVVSLVTEMIDVCVFLAHNLHSFITFFA